MRRANESLPPAYARTSAGFAAAVSAVASTGATASTLPFVRNESPTPAGCMITFKRPFAATSSRPLATAASKEPVGRREYGAQRLSSQVAPMSLVVATAIARRLLRSRS